jgi:hypothetical protein
MTNGLSGSQKRRISPEAMKMRQREVAGGPDFP